ncbi:hypothetical protein P8452_77365 [Trifolium repens]|nr:hypothetical protein P8452_77365 [Trifolium repens]
MGPTRKSRSVNKRFSNIREAASSKDKDAANTSKNRQKASPGIQKKRKLADMLGSQWSKEELERFYEAYREYGKDWKKVALAVRNRTMEMVEALYTMNRAYLSLPEGTASVVGLIAMMTDHYSILGGSDSGKESNEDTEVRKKSKKRPRGKPNDNKVVDGHFSDHSQPQSVASDDGCLSLLKNRHSGIRPHAVRKRTPRVPISYSIGKDNGGKFFSSARQDSKQMVDTNDVTHKIALALAEASQRGGSSKKIGSPNKKNMPSPKLKIGKKHVKPEIVRAKFGNTDMDEGSSELSLGSTEGDIGDYSRKLIHRSGRENTGRGKNQEKGKKRYRKNLESEENINKHLNDIKEASSGTDDGKNQSSFKSNFDTDFANAKSVRSSHKGPGKKSKKLLFEKDEGSAFDALKTLADLSLMMPETNPDTESSVQFNEGNHDMVDESKMETDNGNSSRKWGKVFSDKGAAAPKAEVAYQINAGSRKRKQKSVTLKNDETHTGSHLSGSPKMKVTDEVKSMVKGKRSSVSTAHSRQLKWERSLGIISPSNIVDKARRDGSYVSPIKVLSTNQVGQVNRDRPRRKMEKPKPMVQKDHTVSEKSIASYRWNSIERHKGKLINCLSSYQMRRWCTSEWFYSAIDYPWFSKREFVEYLDHVGLGHVPRLTRIEWGVIRSSLGRPRRFSEQFLIEEKHKLNQYRESVRSHYAEVLAGTKEGLPADLAQPLIVGQRVIAIHPKTREIHDGSILTVDHCRYRVQFDQHELGVEFVMDIDCMPLYPSENMPMSLIRHHITPRINENLRELTRNGKLAQRKISEHTIFSPSDNSDAIKGRCVPPTMHGFSSSCKSQAKAAGSEICNGQSASSSQSSFLDRVHSKEADILAISELTRALEKKELVLSELKQMNDGVSESQKYGDNSVSSGLFCLRQRNAYQASSSVLSLKPMPNFDDPGGQASSSNCSACHNQESISQSHIAEIVESSRRKARTMVVQAAQAMSVFRKTEKVERIEDAINFINNRIPVDDSTASATNFLPLDSITLASRDQLAASSTLNFLARCHVQDDELNSSSDQNEMKIPSELISHCLATLLMIQKCTERQFPPADVAQVLDSAVTSLQPLCSKNLPIYGEIQKCMGIIRNQILALVPT